MPNPTLDLRIHLPVIEQAMLNKTLQAFDPVQAHLTNCSYSGGCAVGVCLPPEERNKLPNQSICTLLEEGRVDAPEFQHEDWVELQTAHDNIMRVIGGRADAKATFVRLLNRLKEEYDVHADANPAA